MSRIIVVNLSLTYNINVQVVVACMTTDFAMQNVLKQIGLNILGTDGMVIPPISSGLVGDHELLSGDQGDEDLDL